MKLFPLLAGVALALGLPLATFASAQSPGETQPSDWRRIARQDVLGAYDVYAANHPGMKDPANPGFPAQLARAREEALAIADRAASRADYEEALGTFSAILSDGHAVVFGNTPAGAAEAKPLWPGFIAAWRGSGVFVHSASATSPAPVGAGILACDGLGAPEFLRRRLLTEGFRPAEAGQYWSRTPLAFTATPGAAREQAGSCTFRLPDGQQRTLPLRYEPAPDDLRDRMRRATDGERTPIGLSEPRPGLFLVGMPDFQPDEAGVRAYAALNQALAARRGELKRARAVILDLRYNNGGSSDWSMDIARALWSRGAVDRRMALFESKVRIWWRASPGNIAYMGDMERQIRRDGHGATADGVARTAAGMKAALAKGNPFFVGPRNGSGRSPEPLPPSDFTTPVYVITPGRCASACLDALDTFTRFPNVKRIGAPTAADSTYMEIRTEPLPSGQGIAVIPMKIWMNRPRAAGEIYRPQIEMDSLDWSTATFLDRIEQDLGERR